MGRQLLAAIDERDDAILSAASDAPAAPCIGVDSSVLGQSHWRFWMLSPTAIPG